MVEYDSYPRYAWIFTRQKKENNLLKFRQPSVPEEKEKKDNGHVKIVPIPAWGKCALRCVVIHVTYQPIRRQ